MFDNMFDNEKEIPGVREHSESPEVIAQREYDKIEAALSEKIAELRKDPDDVAANMKAHTLDSILEGFGKRLEGILRTAGESADEDELIAKVKAEVEETQGLIDNMSIEGDDYEDPVEDINVDSLKQEIKGDDVPANENAEEVGGDIVVKPHLPEQLPPEARAKETEIDDSQLGPKAPNTELASKKDEFYEEFPAGTEITVRRGKRVNQAEITPKYDYSGGRLRIWVRITDKPDASEIRAVTPDQIRKQNGPKSVSSNISENASPAEVSMMSEDAKSDVGPEVSLEGDDLKIEVDNPKKPAEPERDEESSELEKPVEAKLSESPADWTASLDSTDEQSAPENVTTVEKSESEGTEPDEIDNESEAGETSKLEVDDSDVTGNVESDEPKNKEKGPSRFKRFWEKVKSVVELDRRLDLGNKVSYKLITTVFGVKFATDLILWITKDQGDIAEYARGRKSVKKERRELSDIILSPEVENKLEEAKEKIMASENMTDEEKEQLLGKITEVILQGEEAVEDKKHIQAEAVKKLTNTYIVNKKKLASIAKDFLYTSMAITAAVASAGTSVGLQAVTQSAAFSVGRAGAYFASSAAERGQKASEKFEKDKLSEQLESDNKLKAILKDMTVTAARENWDALRGKGKTEESEHKSMDRVQAIAAMARAVGVTTQVALGMTLPELLGKAFETFGDNDVEIDADVVSEMTRDTEEFLEPYREFTIAHPDILGIDTLDVDVSDIERMSPEEFNAFIKTLDQDVLDKISKGVDSPDITGVEDVDGDIEISDEISDRAKLREAMLQNPKAYGYTGNMNPTQVMDWTQEQLNSINDEELESFIEEPRSLHDDYFAGERSSGLSETRGAVEGADIIAEGQEFALEPYREYFMAHPEIIDSTEDEIADMSSEDIAIKLQELDDNTLKVVKRGVDTMSATGVSADGVNKISETSLETPLTDTIDSSEVKGSDSIWRSTRHIFETHAKELGYDGDMEDSDALAKWAETQTANAVRSLADEHGNIPDLVQDNDVVHLEQGNDGNFNVRIEYAEGHEAGHLADTNVDKFFEGAKPEHGDLEMHIDSDSGDQYYEFKTDEGVYKVYDWDRDGEPNVVMPDGTSQEMSPDDLRELMESKDVIFTKAELDSQATEVAAAELETYMNSDSSGEYHSSFYSIAKQEGQLEELLHKIVESHNWPNLRDFFENYCEDNKFSENKTDIFLYMLRQEADHDTLFGFQGSPDEVMGAFEAMIVRDADKLDGILDNTNREWYPVQFGEDGPYALIRRDGAGLLRRAKFYIDLDGDGKADPVNAGAKDLHSDALKEMFSGKRPVTLGTQHIDLPGGDKEFSLQRPDTESPEPAVQENASSAEPADAAAPETEAKFFYMGHGQENDVVVGMGVSGPSPIFRFNADTGVYDSVNYSGSWPNGITPEQLMDYGKENPIGQVSADGQVEPMDDLQSLDKPEAPVAPTVDETPGEETPTLEQAELSEVTYEERVDVLKNMLDNTGGRALVINTGEARVQIFADGDNIGLDPEGQEPFTVTSEADIERVPGLRKMLDSYAQGDVKSSLHIETKDLPEDIRAIHEDNIDQAMAAARDTDVGELDVEPLEASMTEATNQALAMLSESLQEQIPDMQLDSLSDIDRMENANNLAAIKKAIEDQFTKVTDSSQRAELMKVLNPILQTVDNRIEYLGQVETALSDVANVIPGSYIENLDQIRAIQNKDNLEILKKALGDFITKAEKSGGAALDAVEGHRRVLEVVEQTLQRRA